MAALANILSVPPIAIPITLGNFPTEIHFTQLPILIAGILGGPAAGLVTGVIGGLLSSFVVLPRIAFIIGGLAILGAAAGFFSKRLRPLFAGVLAWLVQAPYVAVTDYVWFTLFLPNKMAPEAAWVLVGSLLVKLTIEVVISSALAEVIIASLKKARITL
jgi:LytS/YehU family sensor histidine kinase